MSGTRAADCFHCGLALPAKTFPVKVGEGERPTCCRGCQAVAQTIVDNGLEAYYRTRSAMPESAPASVQVAERLRVYDLPDVQRTFVHTPAAAPHDREAAVLLEGVTCASCVWLIEQRLSRMPGVRSVTVNYAARRARVRWDERVMRLSAILSAVEALGYAAEPYDSTRADDALRTERRNLLWRLFVAGFGMMQVMMYALPAYIDEGMMTPDIGQLMRIAGLLLTAPVVAWAATPFYRGALREISRRRLGMNIPIAVAVLAAFGASAAATLTRSGEVYFDSVTMFVFLLLAARYLELGARLKTSDVQDRLSKLTPPIAERLDRFPDPMRHEQVATAVLRRGDIVVIRPGAVVPADSIVLEGRSATDESLLTGEARGVSKQPGDRLIGGAINRHGPLVARVERVGEESLLSGIVRLMDRAHAEKPHIARASDRAAAVFVAMVLTLSVGAAAVWYFIDPERALWVTISILVVSCPCALSLATPAAFTAATSTLYRSGVLVTRGRALETLAKATHFVFDKTGTVTSGELRLIGVLPLDGRSRETCLDLAAALEAHSEHAIGKALVAAAGAPQRHHQASELTNVPGKGVEGRVAGVRVRLGTPAFVAELNGLPLPHLLALISDDVSVVALGDANGWIALYTLDDSVRSGARRLIAELKAQGRTVCMLSGDRQARVQHLADELGIKVARGAASPEDKVAFVRALQANGATVAMVGDGVNDAPVLAQAHVSLALASGSALAQESSDIVLMRELGAIGLAAGHARLMMRIVRQNLAWATLYNVAALPLAAAGLVTPVAAALGMSFSSLLVVANALRLLRSDANPHGSLTAAARTEDPGRAGPMTRAAV